MHDATPHYLADLGIQAVSAPGPRQSLSVMSGALLDVIVYCPVHLCCVWPENLEPTTFFDCQNCHYPQSSASLKPTSYMTKLVLVGAVCVCHQYFTIVTICKFSNNYKCLDLSQDGCAILQLFNHNFTN